MASEMPPALRIALDPDIRAAHGPELTWAWRLLLMATGRRWSEVPFGEECDVAHCSAARPEPPTAALRIRADPERWRRCAELDLRGVGEREGWSMLEFAGDPASDGGGGAGIGASRLDHDVVFDLFWLAGAAAEARWPRNEHGHPQPRGPLLEQGLFTRALASQIVARLDRAFSERGLPEGVPRWPGGKRAAACLTHDVDYPEVVRWLEPARVLARRGRRGVRPALDVLRGRRHTWHFDSWVELEGRHGARSAFYFVPRKGSLLEYARDTPDPFYDVTTPRFGEALRRLDAAGAEVGIHASYRAYEDESRFALELEQLERAAGVAVAGNRHHYLHLDPERPQDTLLLHEKLGLDYDTTLGHDRNLGWRNGLAMPFFPFHNGLRRELRTLQLPFAWMDQQLFLYGDLNPGEPAELLSGLVATTAEHGGCLVANIHEYTFDEELFPGWSRTYEGLVAEVAGRGDFWIETPRAVAAHWRARAEAIVAASSGLDDGSAVR